MKILTAKVGEMFVVFDSIGRSGGSGDGTLDGFLCMKTLF